MLKKQPGFVLKKIKDSYYLLPFGQQVADQKKGLFLNETGAFLWECLCDTTKHAELVKKLAEHYQLEESDFPMLEEDVTLFLNQLTSFDILKDDGDSADSDFLCTWSVDVKEDDEENGWQQFHDVWYGKEQC